MNFTIFVIICLSSFVSQIAGHSLQGKDENFHPSSSNIPSPTWELRNDVEDKAHWFNSASESLTSKLKQIRIERKAKNLVMFLGDGMSIATITAARIFKGQQDGLKFGEEGQLHMDTFPFIGTSKTYCSDWQVADSACSSTAYLCGTKGNSKTIGVSPAVLYNNCTAQMDKENHVSSILAWAQEAGMSTGIVTTVTVTHSSPAGAFAHIANRAWENNAEIESSGWNSDECDDITEQLVFQQPGSKINVLLGGGRAHWQHTGIADAENATLFGSRTDAKNLVQDWLDSKEALGAKAQYVTGRDQLLNSTNITDNDYLLGLFARLNMDYFDQQPAANDPSLPEMTNVAIQILSKNPNGFFLFVEGARIDHAHHDNYGRRALIETIKFNEAIKIVDDATDDEDTLILVTSDHSHLFSIAGDPARGNPILGFSGNEDNLDGLPYTTLGYINGPGYRITEYNETSSTCARANITSDSIFNVDYRQAAQVPRAGATHNGEDVLILAKGPWAHLFTGVNEQNYIPHGMAFARCINPHGENYCDGYNNNSFGSRVLSTHTLLSVSVVVAVACLNLNSLERLIF